VGAGADDALGDGGGLKVAGLSEGWPKTGPVACRVRSGIGAEERERLSSSSGGSRERRVLVVVATGYEGGGEREGREGVLVLGVLERDMDESIRRTAGARWRRRVKKEDMDTCEKFIGGLHEKLGSLLTNNSKHNTKLK
jgi:hypothetical protein